MSDDREPPLAVELTELLPSRIAHVLHCETVEVVRLADVRRRHIERRKGKSDHPVFPTQDGAA